MEITLVEIELVGDFPKLDPDPMWHSMATANLKKSEDFVTNTTAASKYIPNNFFFRNKKKIQEATLVQSLKKISDRF